MFISRPGAAVAHSLRVVLFFVGWALLASSPAKAQAAWQAAPVLSKLLLYQLLQDENGLLWAAADDGVYRYDGTQTVSLNELVHGPQRLAATRWAVIVGARHDLWLLGSPGLYHYDWASQQLRAVPLPQLLPDWRVLGLVLDTAQQCLWVTNGLHELVCLPLRGSQVGPPRGRWHFTEDMVQLVGVPTGGVWVQGRSGNLAFVQPGQAASHYSVGHLYVQPVIGTVPQQFVSVAALYEARPDHTLREVRRWRPASLGHSTEQDQFWPQLQPGHEQWALGGRLVQLHRVAGAAGVRNVQLASVSFDNSRGYEKPVLYRSFTDNLGTEWCFSPTVRGCYQRHSNAFVQSLRLATGNWYSTRAICRLPDQRLLVSSYVGWLAQAASCSATTVLRPVATLPTQPDQVYYAVAPLRPGQLLAGDIHGVHLLTLAKGSSQQLGDSTGKPLSLAVNTMASDAGGRIWVGTATGLYWLDAAHPWLHAYQPAGRDSLRGIMALAPDSAGFLWVATNEGLRRLSLAAPQQPARRYSLPTAQVLSLVPMGRQVWAGTRDQGLLLIDPRRGLLRQVGTHTGLPSPTVCSLLADRMGDLWLGTYAGIVRYQPSTGHLITLTTADGLADNECNYQSAFGDADGRLYFGSIKGVTRLDPQFLRLASSPWRRLFVAQLSQQADGDTLVRHRFPPPSIAPALWLRDQGTASIRLALTDYLNASANRYWYQLHGDTDSTWHELLASHTLLLRQLPSGDFTLRFRAESGSGLRATNILALQVHMRYTWWKRTWLWVLLSVMLVSSAGSYLWLTRWRAQRERLLIRRRLAYDLHDELGALLARASLQAEYLQGKFPVATATATPLLQDIRTAAQAIRDLVWGLDPSANTLGDLLDRLQDYLARLAPSAPVQLHVVTTIVEQDLILTTEQRQHLYAIFKEAVTNSLRHAQGSTQLQVQVQQQGHRLQLSVVDDGHPQEAAIRVGIGLRSMRERAQLLRGILTVGFIPAGGFRVQLVLHI